MEGGEFLIYRANWIFLQWYLAGMAAFVIIYWPGRTLFKIRHGGVLDKTDLIVVAMTAAAISLFLRQLLWLKTHYLLGTNDPAGAIEYTDDVWVFLQAALLIGVLGMSLHVVYAWDLVSRRMIISGAILWTLLGATLAYQAGALDFTYVWYFSRPSKFSLECPAALL